MKQAAPFLYPKLSSIYNKILQLAGATILIIVLMSLLVSMGNKNNSLLTEHFNYIAKQQLQQSIAGAVVILEQEYDNKDQKQQVLQQYLDGLAKINFLKQAHLYDETGLLIASSTHIEKDLQGHIISHPKAKTINDLYGISPQQRNLSSKLTPFIDEIRHSDSSKYKLHGYMRFTIKQEYLIAELQKLDEEQQSMQRLMLLIAGLIGFLLTRGLNRFSRRGFRLHDKTE